jgi:Cu(I)/Ag(I) efflux system periplasmic protein CusF
MKLLVAMALSAALASGIHAADGGKSLPTQKMTEMSEGEVRKVDRDARKITLRHPEIKQLDMPAMTMVFRVQDDSLLDKVKAGDKVKFRAESNRGAMTITEIELAK